MDLYFHDWVRKGIGQTGFLGCIFYATTGSLAKKGALVHGKQIYFRGRFEGKVYQVSKKVDFSIHLGKFGVSHHHRWSIDDHH